MRAQKGVEIEITWIVDDYRISRLQQKAAQEIDCLGTGIGQHDLAGPGLNPVIGQPARQELPQRQKPHRARIIRQQGGIRARKPPDRPPHCLFRHPGRGKPAATGLGEDGPFVQRLAGYPQRVHRPVQPGLDIGERQRRKRTGYKKSGARPRAYCAIGHQPVIGFDNSGGGNLHGFRQPAHRRQARAWNEAARSNALANARHDLFYARTGFDLREG